MQSAITRTTRSLPPGMPYPPTFRKVNPADTPILFLAMSSATLPLSDVDEYAETMLTQRISMVDGVSQVQVYGAQKYALRVRLDPNLLASRGIALSQVQEALAAQNVNQPTGLLDGPHQAVLRRERDPEVLDLQERVFGRPAGRRHASLTRGSITAYNRSTTRFATMMTADVTSVIPVIRGRSDSRTELTASAPSPGRLKMLSVMIAPPRR